MKIILYVIGFAVAIFGAHKYYDFLLASERLHQITENYGHGGYWIALLLPGLILGVTLFQFGFPKSKIRLLASLLGGGAVVAIGLLGSTMWCIFRGVGSCV
jgi:hypothetical protein